ncbi:homoserine dehydrogenase [Actinomyces sp. zg-332]|uniref:homoserine dehydrogenase n=1 Tax=Actinomyces sp. zg-332 TaxID=2708340 RepID=UPI00141E695D|nr:homoserine dehydrogenase [Actinomyces sp. zg-332]QPK94493.1 homoserine dehydrogenase [Actinomyces sp. zg-332]
MNKIKIAILGSSNVAAQVVRLISEQQEELDQSVGTKVDLIGVGVKNIEKIGHEDIDKRLFSTDIPSLIRKADIVVELVGGLTDAKDYVFEALSLGKTVVTANKMLLSHFYEQLMEACETNKTELYYEGSVCGAIPIVHALRESLRNDKVESIMGVVNSTTNYVLDKMTSEGTSFEEALQQAQDLGFAETDSTADVYGTDAASKAAILSSLAFSSQISIDQVDAKGIEDITVEDIKTAKEKGYALKLIFVASRREDHNAMGIHVSVRPTLLPLYHPLATVKGIHNAVLVDTQLAGRLMFYGQGYGINAVASTVLNDIVRASVHKKYGIVFTQNYVPTDLNILSDEYISGRFYMNLTVDDRPGVLSQVTGICGANNLSIDSLVQDRQNLEVRLSIFTHETTYSSLKKTVEMFNEDVGIISVNSILYVEK